PDPLSGPTNPFAMTAPVVKLIVDVVGALSGSGVADTEPFAVDPVTVMLPVTATAASGTPQWPLTWRVFATLVASLPWRPDRTAGGRVSTIRDGFSGTNFRPVRSWRK